MGSRSAFQARSVVSKTALSRLEAVSSGPISRKVRGFAAITSRSSVPSTRVGSLVCTAGDLTSTACVRKSGRRSGASNSPPLACGFALILRAPSGTVPRIAGIGPPRSSNSSSGRYERIHSSSIARCAGLSRTSASGTWWARQVPSTGRPSTSRGPVQPLGVRRMIIGRRESSPAR